MSLSALVSRPKRAFVLAVLALLSLSVWHALTDASIAPHLLLRPYLRPSHSLTAIANGHWHPAPELRNTSRSAWGHWKCFARDAQPLPGEEFLHADDSDRVEDVDGWKWLLEDGRPMRDFEPEEVLARAFRSRIGYVIVGDSIGLQTFEALRYMAAMPEPHTAEHAFIGKYNTDTDQYLTLAPSNILRARLLARADLAHVPRTRFDEPFAHFWRADVLLQAEEDLLAICTALGTDCGGRNGTWTYRRYVPWIEEIRAYAGYNGGRAWEGEMPSPVMISAGPHFDPGRFVRVSGEDVRLVYGETVRKIADALLSVQSVPLRVLFRSTLPAHPSCDAALSPVPPSHPSAALALTPNLVPYAWDAFAGYNELAREAFDARRRGGVTLEWMDVWGMGVTRPDAHVAKVAVLENGTRPMYDCLHWCTGSVPRWVVHAWWHALAEEV